MEFKRLKGLTIVDVKGLEKGSEEVFFETKNAAGETRKFHMLHYQDCCESVYVADVDGDVTDLIGAKVVEAYEETKDASGSEDVYDSGTWTFYFIQTTKGGVWIRWLGESNGYYSESVDFEEVN